MSKFNSHLKSKSADYNVNCKNAKRNSESPISVHKTPYSVLLCFVLGTPLKKMSQLLENGTKAVFI